ncbi:YqaE/Pmp3 family membrane protein [Segetibacter sp.]|jgi:uncharacterized membrane protein YqaE (UPF0057 family)|uniref:YqaE/Pmp3 family membrane protein n=1 Tax=Segetibacter sp. TaxID=2231182 RepID=UPI00262BE779|nr:YqaE/Pmp3 family membrane protein [Segetibacter sp.]MCW3081016.1 hypothetical protein [Segetibacter sp.]
MRKTILLFSFPLLLALPSMTSVAATTSKVITEAASAVSPEPAIGSIQEGLKEFNSLSRREKKSRFKEMKKAIKEFKEQKKAGSDVSTNTLLLVLLALFIPPLAVYLHEGETNNRFWISVLLTILGLVLFNFGGILFLGTLPAIVYALIVILGS